MLPPARESNWFGLTADPLPHDTAVRWATTPASGAVVTFLGVVRQQSEGRTNVSSIDYEAYEEVATGVLEQVGAEARRRWPLLERLVILHRFGNVALAEASVLVVAAAPHRGDAFDAARYCIDTVKETLPVWKREHWEGGSDWAAGAHPVRTVRPPLESDTEHAKRGAT